MIVAHASTGKINHINNFFLFSLSLHFIPIVVVLVNVAAAVAAAGVADVAACSKAVIKAARLDNKEQKKIWVLINAPGPHL